MSAESGARRAHEYEPLPAARAELWSKFGRWDTTYFPSFVGLQLVEVRIDYACMRLPFRPELLQPALSVLPLTALNDALRAVILDHAGATQLLRPAAILVGWGAAGAALGLRIFRWA